MSMTKPIHTGRLELRKIRPNMNANTGVQTKLISKEVSENRTFINAAFKSLILIVKNSPNSMSIIKGTMSLEEMSAIAVEKIGRASCRERVENASAEVSVEKKM